MNSLRLLSALFCALSTPVVGAFAANPLDVWTPLTVSSGTWTPNDLIFANGEFWAVASSGRVEHSENGADWQVIQSPAKDGLRDIVYAEGRFVVVGNNGLIMSSPNGLDWDIHEENPSGTAADLYDINYSNGKFLAIGRRRVRVSDDGINWTPGTISGSNFEAKSVAWGNGTYVAVGTSGTITTEDGHTVSSDVQTSPDGITWTAQPTGLFFNATSIAFFNGMFVAGEFDIFTSPNGIDWDLAENLTTTSALIGLKVVNGRLFGYGANGLLISSSNGTDWTVHTSGTDASIRALDYDGERLLMYRYKLTGGGTGPAVSDPWAPVGGNQPGDPNDPNDPDLPTDPDAAAQIINISTRAWVGTGDTKLISGFVVSGTTPKQVLIRAVGPTLGKKFGVAGALADPMITLYSGAGQEIASNNDWGTFANQAELVARTAEVYAFSLEAGSKDAAMLATLNPGAYTLHTAGVNGGTGIALAEVYDCSTGESCRLVNISTRGFVGTGQNVTIPGFVISGNKPKKLLVRGIGPGLTKFGVSGTITDPKVTLYNSKQAEVASNDDWSTYPDQAELAAVTAQVYAFKLPAGSKDAATIVTVNPGLYTAVVSGNGNGTGVGLVEVYEIE